MTKGIIQMQARAMLPGNPGHHAVQFLVTKNGCACRGRLSRRWLRRGSATLLYATLTSQRIRAELVSCHFASIAHQSVIVISRAGMLGIHGQRSAASARFRRSRRRARTRLLFGGESTCAGLRNGRRALSRRQNDCASRSKASGYLAKAHSFSLLCGYASHVASDRVYADVCAHHTHVHGALAVA